MTYSSTLSASLIALAMASAAQAQAHEPPAPFPPESIQWSDGPPTLPEGALIAVLSGDPGAEGPFVLRLKLPADYAIPAHTHSGDELVTVISGELNVGHGEALDRDASLALPAGSFVEIPAGHPHFAWTTDETVVQIHGPGPFDIQYINPADDPMTN